MLGRSLCFDALGLLIMAIGLVLLVPLCVILFFAVALLATLLLGGSELTFGPGMLIFLGAVIFAAALAPSATRPVLDRLAAIYFGDQGREAA